MFKKTAPAIQRIPQRVVVQINVGQVRFDEAEDVLSTVLLVTSHNQPTLIVNDEGTARLVRLRQNQATHRMSDRTVYMNEKIYQIFNPSHNLNAVLKTYEQALADEGIHFTA